MTSVADQMLLWGWAGTDAPSMRRVGRLGAMRNVLLLVAAGLIFLPGVASAQFTGTVRNVACSGSITSALQTAVNASVDTDVVNIGAGTCTAGQVSWSNKNIKVQGQGIGTTTVTGLSFDVKVTTKAGFRITGLSVGCPTVWKVDAINRTTGIKGWRIDNIAWSCATCGQNMAVQVYGITWGLIDNSTFNNMGNAIFLMGYAENTDEVNPWPPDGVPGMGGYNWLLPLNLGSDEAVYVEDNSFTLANGCYFGVGDLYYGSKMVFRHNAVTNAYLAEPRRPQPRARGQPGLGNLQQRLQRHRLRMGPRHPHPFWYGRRLQQPPARLLHGDAGRQPAEQRPEHGDTVRSL